MKNLSIDNYKTLDLKHRAYFYFMGSKKLSIYMAASQEGELTIFDKDGNVIDYVELSCKLSSIDFSAEKQMYCYSTETELVVSNFQKQILFKESGQFEAIFFSSEKNIFWVIKKASQEKVYLRVYDCNTWRLITELPFDDIYGDSSYLISNGATDEQIVLWMAAGQDGQSTFFVTLKNHDLLIEKFEQEDTLPAIFNSDGSDFFVGNEEVLTVYRTSNKQEQHKFILPDTIKVFDSMFYLNQSIIAIIGECGFHILNPRNGSLNEVIIKGHETKPVSHYYPNLEDEDGELVADFVFGQLFGDILLISCRNHQLKKEKHSVLIVKKEQLIEVN